MIRAFLERLRGKGSAPVSFCITPDTYSLNFFLPIDVFEACKGGEGDEWLLNQFIALDVG